MGRRTKKTSGPARRSGDEPPTRARPRDHAADRALFEQAVERLGAGDIDKRSGSEVAVDSEHRARFARRISRGDFEPAASIDLHGLDREQASTRLRSFLSSASGEAVLVIHGRGEGIVRAAAIAELERHPRVAEHLSAPRQLGGDGARLVRLRRRSHAR
jgi:DNA-nicking Smr family endonuclease